MKLHPITNAFKRLMPPDKDVVCLWNGDIERWQVYEVGGSRIMLLNGKRHKSYRLMWTIQGDQGVYRNPDATDIARMQETVATSMAVWSNSGRVADKMDDRDIRRETEISPAAADKLRQAAELMGFMRNKGFLTK